MRKKRIVHVIHWPKSGIVTLVRDMLPLFDDNQFEQHVLFFEDDEKTILQFKEICTSVSSLRFSYSPLAGVIRYRKALNALQPDILHTHSLLPTLLGCLLFRPGSRIITVHNTYPYFSKNDVKSILKRWLSKRSLQTRNTLVVAVSLDVKNALESMASSDTKIHVIENGIRTDTYKKISAKSAKDLSPCELISVGRLSSQKAYNFLLRAFKLVLQEKPSLRLTIVGDGPESKNLYWLCHSNWVFLRK